MPGDTMEYRPTSTSELLHTLRRFVEDNERSGNIELRWLAEQAKPLRWIVEGYQSGGAKALSQTGRESLKEFRLMEINAEQSKLDKARAALDAEAARLKAASA